MREKKNREENRPPAPAPTAPADAGPAAAETTGGFMPLVLRLTWMGLGNLFLLGAALIVAQNTLPLIADGIFWATAIGLIVVRYVDITQYNGETTECVPATLADWKTYSIGLILIAATIYGLARLSSAFGWMA